MHPGHAPTLAAAASQSPLFFSGASDGTIKAWAPRAAPRHAKDSRGPDGPDGGVCVVGSSSDMDLEENVASFTAHAGAVTGLHVDGHTLYRCDSTPASSCERNAWSLSCMHLTPSVYVPH